MKLSLKAIGRLTKESEKKGENITKEFMKAHKHLQEGF